MFVLAGICLIESQLKRVTKCREPLLVFVLAGICLIESQLKRVKKGREPLLVFVLARYLPYKESTERSNERQGATLGVL